MADSFYSREVSLLIFPGEWIHLKSKSKIYAYLLRTAVNKFGGEISVDDNAGKVLGNFDFEYASGFFGEYLGCIEIEESSTFPINIRSTIKCSTNFGFVKAPPAARGLKESDSGAVPVCYEASIYCNDDYHDNDWSDCVLMFQLFNMSAD
ncbi:hypothetical protein Misp06_04334 [Microbulbifer sp. NBRC 101763]|uniref:hypothetical protein n=1 Tax=Microbulbifer sp. NBRC 101763 TaxID=1113820 RepID=UPI0030A0D86A